VAQKYRFEPSQAWLDHVRTASLRIAGGCSASFISPRGLVMTNYHCVVDCVKAISTAGRNLVNTGFTADSAADEWKCPDFELDQLTAIRDVTEEVQKSLAGKTGEAANNALQAETAKLQQSCGSDPSIRCDLVSLYHGGSYDLYRYKRYSDVRLVFSPEFDAAFFGGDPDNFNFPRFDFDLGLLRAYENNQPAASSDYFRWSREGSKEGQLVFVSGNPGGTSRELTVSQLEFERDKELPALLPEIGEYRGMLEEFIATGPEQAREANENVFFIGNFFKVESGRQQALMDPQFFKLKVDEEKRLRDAVGSRSMASEAKAWDDLAQVQVERTKLYLRQDAMDGNFFFHSGLLGRAIDLVRIPTERAKSNGERLPEYTDQSLVEKKEELLASIPLFKDLGELSLRFAFTNLQRKLGADDPFVRKMLRNESPEQLAHRLVSGTHIDDSKERERLFNGGLAAIETSDDPMIRFAVLIDPDLRLVRKEYEAKIDAPTRSAAERIAKLRFAVYGTSIDPDATFTARLNYGAVKGFNDARGQWVPPYTTFAGLFERANGAPPFALPPRWLSAKSSLSLSTPMNFSTTNDIIGGNSGSPVIDQDARIVGLIFDGNIYSLGGDYGYDGTSNRAVAVDSRALLEGLRAIYHLERVVEEIESGR
ncbi:MAG: S46 family peptidase, partial [Acidobacteria bacterium]|nr:S46 family peptidase [Acidobacteriota bacterium]